MYVKDSSKLMISYDDLEIIYGFRQIYNLFSFTKLFTIKKTKQLYTDL